MEYSVCCLHNEGTIPRTKLNILSLKSIDKILFWWNLLLSNKERCRIQNIEQFLRVIWVPRLSAPSRVIFICLTTSLLQKQRRRDTARPWVEVVTEEITSYTYSKVDPCSGLIGISRNCNPNIGIRIRTAFADLKFTSFFLLKLFSNRSLFLRTVTTL